MISTSQILSQLSTLFPLLLLILVIEIFFKKLSAQVKKRRYTNLMEKNRLKGLAYEIKCGKYYEEQGYDVEYYGINKGKKDAGIDLICRKENQIKLLVQCKNHKGIKSINHENVKVFHSNAIKFIDLNNIEKQFVKLKYAVPNQNILDNSAIKVFQDRYYNCRYEII